MSDKPLTSSGYDHDPNDVSHSTPPVFDQTQAQIAPRVRPSPSLRLSLFHVALLYYHRLARRHIAPKMAQQTQFTSDNFVESAGAIAFHLSKQQVCLAHHKKKNEWLLSKGRRNVGESRQQAALREVEEETGYKCRMLPITLTTRTPPAVEGKKGTPDMPVKHEGVSEPFMLTQRVMQKGHLKLIWWYVAAIDEESAVGEGEATFAIKLFDFEDALSALTYEGDREVVRRAIEILRDTLGEPAG